MPIPYRFTDFVPVIAQEKFVGFTTDVQIESLQDTVVRANDWIVRHGVEVVNIETVLLPAPLDQPEYSTGANGFAVGDRSQLVQVVRVWYTIPDETSGE